MKAVRKPRYVQVVHPNDSSTFLRVQGRCRYVLGPFGERLRELRVNRIELLDKKPARMGWYGGPWMQLVGTRRGVLMVYEQSNWAKYDTLAATVEMCVTWQ